jgi:hypothetical protein
MSTVVSTLTAGLLLCAAARPAQSQPVEQRQLRYQIGVMERVLEEAVEHGANLTRDRLQALVPPDMLVSEGARVRGFRIDDYGMFFDVEVPTLLYQGTLPWMFRTLDQNDLGLASALETLRAVVQKTGDTNLEQALKRVELQVTPVPAGASSSGASTGIVPPPPPPERPGARLFTGSTVATRAAAATGPSLDDPEEAYRAEVKNVLMDAMLDYSRGLSLETGEWLHIAARRRSDDPRLAPTDTDARTVMIRVRAADLTQFLAGQISREEARKRMDVKVF